MNAGSFLFGCLVYLLPSATLHSLVWFIFLVIINITIRTKRMASTSHRILCRWGVIILAKSNFLNNMYLKITGMFQTYLSVNISRPAYQWMTLSVLLSCCFSMIEVMAFMWHPLEYYLKYHDRSATWLDLCHPFLLTRRHVHRRLSSPRVRKRKEKVRKEER